jgi:hypothetical protein
VTLLRRFLVCALVWGAFSIAVDGAAAKTLTGDTCSATGSGTSFTLTVNIPAGEPTQGGFAIGGPGVTIVVIVIVDHPGTMSTNGLPPLTSNELLLNSNPLTSGGMYQVNVMTSGPFSGPFNVVPANFPPTMYFPGFSCPLATGTGQPPPVAGGPSNLFTPVVEIYDPVTNTWQEVVNVPGPGTVEFNQVFAPLWLRSVAAVEGVDAAKPLIQSGKVVAKRAGKVKLTLRPTSAGQAILKQKGLLKVRLKITFTPNGGKLASKIVSVTLRAKK